MGWILRVVGSPESFNFQMSISQRDWQRGSGAMGTISQLAAQVLFWKNPLRFYIISNKATFPTCHII